MMFFNQNPRLKDIIEISACCGSLKINCLKKWTENFKLPVVNNETPLYTFKSLIQKEKKGIPV